MAFGALICSKIFREIRAKNVDGVTRLLNEHALKKDKFFHNIEPLLIACSEPDGYVAAKFLIEEGKMDVNMVCSKCHLTPLAMACRNNNLKVVQYLLQHPDIDPNKTALSDTPLQLAIIMNRILNLELDDNNKINNIELIKLLLTHEKIDINAVSTDQESGMYSTPFISALIAKRFDVADLIINDKRFKIKNGITEGLSELHQVIINDHYPNETHRFDHIMKLIAAGADPTYRQDLRKSQINDNFNAIEAARYYDLPEIAEFLETARLEQDKNKYQELRNKSQWQSNPNPIFDSREHITEQLHNVRIGATY